MKSGSKIHMIGIKGVGMTMLAQFLVKDGYLVSGSDSSERFLTDKILKAAKIRVAQNFAPTNILTDVSLIIYSTAYNPQTNPELKAAIKSKTRVISYPEALAWIFNKHKGVAVVGSHGKTTTSAWLGFVAKECGLDPSVLVGSNVPQFKGASLHGDSKYLIAEVDEYQNKLRYFFPWMVVLNNIDHDHHDFFKTKASYIKAFRDFVRKIPKSGILVANFDDLEIRKLSKLCRGQVISYGLKYKSADYLGKNIKLSKDCQKFEVNNQNFSILLNGQHNISNSLAVIAASQALGLPMAKIKIGLAKFVGTERRAQILGEYNQALIIDDYAHHPTEIKATLLGLKQKYPKKKIISVFHPHTYTRTKSLLSEFSRSFLAADELILLDIYGSAREKQGGVSSSDLLLRIEKYNKRNGSNQKLKYIPGLEDCAAYLKSRLKPGDLLLLMGAGDVFRIGQKLLASDL
jgi:UDP-N-acetylmuramate--alanine ligase